MTNISDYNRITLLQTNNIEVLISQNVYETPNERKNVFLQKPKITFVSNLT